MSRLTPEAIWAFDILKAEQVTRSGPRLRGHISNGEFLHAKDPPVQTPTLTAEASVNLHISIVPDWTDAGEKLSQPASTLSGNRALSGSVESSFVAAPISQWIRAHGSVKPDDEVAVPE
jgi:hypothetical protein